MISNKTMLGWLVIVSTLVSPVVAGWPKNASSYVNFQIPHSLYKKGGYSHQRAHFGNHWSTIAPDGSMVQTLLTLPENQTDLCHYYDDNLSFTPEQRPFLLLVDRGGHCTFVDKARHAQHLGASGVLFATNKCGCDETNCTAVGGEACEAHPPIVADDGSGGDISIPAVLLPKSTADDIRRHVHHKEPILAELAWQFPKVQDSVTVDMWYSPNNPTSMDFLTNFSKLLPALQDKVQFHPHYSILEGTDFHCHGNSDHENDACYNLCTNKGRYCAASHHGITGKQVVTETLRRLCISKHYHSDHFWDYLDHFHEWCQSTDYFGNGDCVKDAYKHSKVDAEKIASCMKDSGDIEKDDKNTLLELALEESKNYNIFQTPTVLINDAPLRWALSPKIVLEHICLGYDHGKAPHVCYQCVTCGDPIKCATRSPMKCHATDGDEKEDPSKGSSHNKKKKGGGWKWMFFIILLCAGGGFVYYKKYMEDGDGMISMSLGDALMSDTA